MDFGLAAALAQPSESLSVSGLPLHLSDEQLNAVFSQYGSVDQCKMLDPIPGLPGRGALVTMKTVEEAGWLVQNVNNNIPSGLQGPVTIQFLAAPGQLPVFQGFQAAPPPVIDASAIDAATLAAISQLAASGMLGGAGMLGGGAGMLGGGALALPEAAAPVVAFQVGVPLPGTVKRWDDQKGFGFIVPDGGGPDVFVHIGDLPGGNKLVNGAKVTFEAIQDASKGPGRFRARTCSGGVPKETVTEAPAAITDNLFITGLPLDIAEDVAKAVFSQYGSVISLKKLQNQPNKPDAAVLIRMGSMEQAEWMVKNISTNIPTGLTTPVYIRFAENKGQGTRPAGGGMRFGPY